MPAASKQAKVGSRNLTHTHTHIDDDHGDHCNEDDDGGNNEIQTIVECNEYVNSSMCDTTN